ncbi:MAG: MurR/RpiR family transcriptional regulator [Pseudomonadota bacterium]
MVGRLQTRLQLGKGAEKRLVESILGDLNFATYAPIADIAARAQVSEPTVTRLARALGFSGTREMKFHLAQSLAIGGAYLRGSNQKNIDDRPLDDVITKVSEGAHAALELMSVALSEIDLPTITQDIAKANQVVVYGTGGGSSMAAVELQNRLFRLGLQATAYSDPQLQRMSASVLDAKALVIAFSISGHARSVIDAVSIAKQYNARTITVTSPGSPLANIGDTLFPLTFKEDNNLYKPTASRYALLAAVDFLAMGTAMSIGPKVLERLRRVRQSLASQDIGYPELPLGD